MHLLIAKSASIHVDNHSVNVESHGGGIGGGYVEAAPADDFIEDVERLRSEKEQAGEHDGETAGECAAVCCCPCAMVHLKGNVLELD